MNPLIEQILLAFAGYLFHLLKMYQESLKRNEEFIKKPMIVSVAANVLAICILVYIGGTLPADLIVMSPLTCVIIGSFASSMLSGFINVKKPKAIDGAEG
jgi:uncharacterized membrane-anchored protein